MPKHLKLLYFAALLLIWVPLGAPPPASCADQGKVEISASLTRHDIPYQPEFEAFPPALKSMVSPLERATELAKTNQPQANELLGSVVQEGNTLLKSINRGYYDELYHLQGIAYEGLGEFDKAIDAYHTSLTYKASEAAVLFRHAYLLRRKHRCSEAAPELREVAWLNPKFETPVLYLESECLMELGKTAEALTILERAHSKAPAFLPAAERLLQIRLLLLKNTNDSRERAVLEEKIFNTASSIVQVNPDDRDSSLLLSRFLVQRSDPFFDTSTLKHAEQLAKKFAVASAYEDEEAVKALVDVHLKQRKINDAEAALKQALAKKPNSEVLQAASRQLEIERKAQTLPDNPS